MTSTSTPETADPAGVNSGQGDPASAGEPSRRQLLERMLLIRAFDSTLPRLYDRGLIQGSSHAAIGQEAVAVGACSALRTDDVVTSTHRGHGHAIAKGADVGRMMAELLGRETGYCRGKGGSMHIADFSVGMLGANGIVGGGFGLATGAALAMQLQGVDRVALCFFGEGALNQGAFLECANMASIWKLPVVFLCENNHFAMSATPEEMLAVKDLTERARGAGLAGDNVDGMDVEAVRDAVAAAAARARSGHGPYFIAAECYRFEGHFSGDRVGYRDQEEFGRWQARDPILSFAERLRAGGELGEGDLEQLRTTAEQTVQDALDEAVAAPFPDAREAWEDLYA